MFPLLLQIPVFVLNRTATTRLPFYTHPAHSVLNSTLLVDIACQMEAELADLRGTFIAAVSGPKRSLRRLLELQRKLNLPVINTKVGGAYQWLTFEVYTTKRKNNLRRLFVK